MSSKLHFVKMSGAGNDFVVVDNRKNQVPTDLAARFSARVADRKRSVGADGVLLIEPSSRKAFRMRYFNADGSEAEMCGNGGRCIARYATLIGAAGESMEFENLAGDFRATVLPGGVVNLQMTQPQAMQLNQQLEVDGQFLVGHSLNTGVPHLVVPLADIGDIPVFELGRKLRYHEAFAPKGTNVNFVQVTGKHSLLLRTYERGVEDETLACGTGAVAAAILMSALGQTQAPVEVTTHGGDKLEIAFKLGASGLATEVFLKGGADITFEGDLDLQPLLKA
jgi:diaminopimelate epimerase